MSISRVVVGVMLLGTLAAAALAAPTPVQLLDQMAARWNTVNDYDVVVGSTRWEGGKEAYQQYRYAFKKPRMVRLQTTAGEDRGGELVVRPDGVIRGRKSSGPLKVFAVTMSREDRRLRGGDGVGVWELDQGSEINRLRSQLRAAGAQSSVTGPTNGQYVLTVRPGSGAAGTVNTYWIDSRSLWIVKSERARAGTLLQRDIYSSLRVNPGFTNAFFEF
jgi:outer membrane lipoprotein-sorting protein